MYGWHRLPSMKGNNKVKLMYAWSSSQKRRWQNLCGFLLSKHRSYIKDIKSQSRVLEIWSILKIMCVAVNLYMFLCNFR